jgi:tetraacyldisaccharide 4'-kinase
VTWKHLLLPLTPLYWAAVRARAAAYARGLLRAHRLPVPVVSVGNLTFGGTGKSPTVVALARDLVSRGRRPAVLTRGWGRLTDEPVVLIGPDAGVTADRAGDEPLEIATRLPGVPVVVDGDRVRGAGRALELSADVLLLDDGFQHLRLARDLDLLLVDAGDPWGGGRLPPLGRLREPVSALERASAVLVTKLPADHAGPLADISRRIGKVTAEMPVMGSRLVATRVRTGDSMEPVERLRGRRVHAFAGLGRPEAFAALLEDSGAEMVGHRWFGDHHRYTAAELAAIVEQAHGLDAVPITTGKDAVKLPLEAPVWVLQAEVVPLEGHWDRLWSLLPGGLP